MTRCAIPKCKTDSRVEEKKSLFRVPKDSVTWKKWEKAIPSILKLRQKDVVCGKHFDKKDISREWIKHDAMDIPRLPVIPVNTLFVVVIMSFVIKLLFLSSRYHFEFR